MCFCLSNSSLSSCRRLNEVCQAVECLLPSGCSKGRDSGLWLIEEREVPGVDRGDLVAARHAAAAQERSQDSCKGLGWVGRGGGRGMGSGGGDAGEDLLQQGPCSSGCHHLSLLAPFQRTRHSSYSLLEQARRAREGAQGALDEQPFP